MISSNILVYIDHVVLFHQAVVLQDDQNLISNTSVDIPVQYYYQDVQFVYVLILFVKRPSKLSKGKENKAIHHH